MAEPQFVTSSFLPEAEDRGPRAVRVPCYPVFPRKAGGGGAAPLGVADLKHATLVVCPQTQPGLWAIPPYVHSKWAQVL